MSRRCIHELDVVALTRAVEGWPERTEGTVIRHVGDSFLVEVPPRSDEADLALATAPRDALEIVLRRGKVPA